jgi:hypothetical protein
LEVKGTLLVKTGNNTPLIIDNSGYASNPALYGGTSLGKSAFPWYNTHSAYYYTTSDGRQKENIRQLPNSLDLIKRLNGVKYDFKAESAAMNSLRGNGNNTAMVDKQRKNHVGFIAQDVISVIPEVVFYDDSTDFYSIDYTKFTPYIVEAIKEQQLVIQSLQEEVVSLKKMVGNSNLKSAEGAIITPDTPISNSNFLNQNAPNPFSQTTNIKYSVTEGAKNAMICIYDMNGTQLKCIALNQTGQGDITINGGELKPGMFLYALIVDGQLIDTKKMVLTE